MEIQSWRDLWWRQVPESALKVSHVAGEIAADGIYLCRWPQLAAFAPPVCLVFGLLGGATHFWAGQTFSFSLTLMALMTIVASFSAALGAWFWCGYVAGDIAVYQVLHNRPYFFASLRAAIISYVLLAMLLMFLSPATRRFRQSVFPYTRFPIIAAALVHSAVEAVLVFIWVHAVPILSRPVFTWLDHSPPVEAMRPLQTRGWILVVIAVICGVSRALFQSYAFRDSSVARLDSSMRRSASPTMRSSARLRISPLRLVLVAAFSAFLLSGLFVSWLDAIVVFIVFLVVTLTRPMLSLRVPAWASLMVAVPAFVRLAAALAVNAALGWLIVRLMWQRTSSFRPITAVVLVSCVVFVLLFPTPFGDRPRRKAVAR